MHLLHCRMHLLQQLQTHERARKIATMQQMRAAVARGSAAIAKHAAVHKIASRDQCGNASMQQAHVAVACSGAANAITQQMPAVAAAVAKDATAQKCNHAAVRETQPCSKYMWARAAAAQQFQACSKCTRRRRSNSKACREWGSGRGQLRKGTTTPAMHRAGGGGGAGWRP